jgi:four helix bundle protein
MNESDFKLRTKKFSLRIIKLVGALPKTAEGRAIGNQLIRSGTSVGANYRAVCRARSKADFIAKLGIVEEETDECLFWLELIIEAGLIEEELIQALYTEANEILSIVVTSIKSARK